MQLQLILFLNSENVAWRIKNSYSVHVYYICSSSCIHIQQYSHIQEVN